jgi:Family of unknown function (DUF6644)
VSASILHACQWLESTPVGLLVRESPYAFPILVAVHIVGLTLSVGIVVWFDLRLLGVSMRGAPAPVVYRQLMPWAFTGFGIMFLSGALLLTGFATAAYGNVYFRAKLVAILLAGVNAFGYHAVTERRIAHWDNSTRIPLAARMAGLISIAMWATVILAGRMMSYTLYSR